MAKNVSWSLDNCCDKSEITFICLWISFLIINFFLWNTLVAKPFRLIAVFLHEFSHATACWMTGGTVKGIEVHSNEGGVTKYTGGIQLLVIPAGYLGGAFWGGVLVVLSGNRVAATVAASCLVASLLVSLRFSPNRTMVYLCLGFAILTGLAIYIEWHLFSPLLQFITLYYGVFIGSFSIWDVYDDLIVRTVDGSDAKACHELIPCCFPKCVGVQFALVAIAFQVLGLYFALVWIGSS